MSKNTITLNDFIKSFIDPQDTYYSDTTLIENIITKTAYSLPEMERLYIQQEFEQTNRDFPDPKDTESIKRSMFFLLIKIWITSKIKTKICGKIINLSISEIDDSYILANANDIKIHKHDIMIYFSQNDLPLPYTIFPSEQNNTRAAKEKNDKEHLLAYIEAFECASYNNRIAMLKAMTPRTITEADQQKRLIEEIERERENFIKTSLGDETFPEDSSLSDIPTDHIILLLEVLCSDKSILVRELQSRGFKMGRIGQLLNFNNLTDSKDANEQRAKRALKSGIAPKTV